MSITYSLFSKVGLNEPYLMRSGMFLPTYGYTDDSFALVVENLTLQGRNLFPNIIEMEANNLIEISLYDVITDDHNGHHGIVQVDVSWAIHSIFFFSVITGF